MYSFVWLFQQKLLVNDRAIVVDPLNSLLVFALAFSSPYITCTDFTFIKFNFSGKRESEIEGRFFVAYSNKKSLETIGIKIDYEEVYLEE